MTLPFLSHEWFDAVMALRAEAEASLGDAGVPAEVRQVKLNVSVPHARGEHRYALRDGEPRHGHIEDADTHVTVDYDTARRLIIDGDLSAGMQAFMAGQIRVAGDMSKLLLLQQQMTATPTDAQKALRAKIVAFTVF